MSSNPSSFNGGRPMRLKDLVQQLRMYKRPAHFDRNEIEEQRREYSKDKLISPVGIAESAAPVANPDGIKRKRAAVLICLFEDVDGHIRVILTKRSSTMSSHSGEVSLPGGMAEEGDVDDADTATREAKEEIGLDRSLVNVVAILEPFGSKNGVRVTPVIGILSDKQSFKQALNASEVEVLFDAPFEMFLKDENWRSEEIENNVGRKYVLHFFNYKVKNKLFIIWGLTAELLIQSASLVYQRPPQFVRQIPNFKFPLFVTRENITPRM